MCFSVDGRFLVSSDAGGPIHIHDLSNGYLLATWKPSTTAVTLAFSREGNILASGKSSILIDHFDINLLAYFHIRLISHYRVLPYCLDLLSIMKTSHKEYLDILPTP